MQVCPQYQVGHVGLVNNHETQCPSPKIPRWHSCVGRAGKVSYPTPKSSLESTADEARRDRPAGIQASTRCAPRVARQSVPREPFSAGSGLTGASHSARESALVSPLSIYKLARMRVVGVVAL
jgi:hypothetical protein